MTQEQKLNEAEKAVQLKANGTTRDKVEQALGVCSEWVQDASGEWKKDCYRCCYWDDNDIAALMCSGRLMKDARKVIQEQKQLIENLQHTNRSLSKQLVMASQREWNG